MSGFPSQTDIVVSVMAISRGEFTALLSSSRGRGKLTLQRFGKLSKG
jgi:hypothetical protein